MDNAEIVLLSREFRENEGGKKDYRKVDTSWENGTNKTETYLKSLEKKTDKRELQISAMGIKAIL